MADSEASARGRPKTAAPAGHSAERSSSRRPATADDLRSGKIEIPIAARFKGPGPAAYTVPSTFATPYVPNKAPAWTFGVRIQGKDGTSYTPGPGAFYPRVTRNGHIGGPAFSIQGRFRTERHDSKAVAAGANQIDTPGPAAYNIKNAVANPLIGAPAYTILGRTPPPKQDNNPGPAQYNIGTTIGTKVLTGPSAPATSILGQRTHKVVCSSPGPALYNSPEASKRILKSAPAYSLGYRIQNDPASGHGRGTGPGPANYTPSLRPKTRASPSYSFGVRHSEFEAYVSGESDEIALF